MLLLKLPTDMGISYPVPKFGTFGGFVLTSVGTILLYGLRHYYVQGLANTTTKMTLLAIPHLPWPLYPSLLTGPFSVFHFRVPQSVPYAREPQEQYLQARLGKGTHYNGV